MSESIYMNILTGETGTRDDWWYELESGEHVNAVDLDEVVEVFDVGNVWVEA